jgi:hypothetical protein
MKFLVRTTPLKKTLLMIAGCLALTACANGAETKAARDAAVAQCQAPYPRQVGSYVDRARCIVETDAHFYPTDPLVPVLGPIMISLAMKVDHGEMSLEAALEQYALTRFAVQQEMARTNAAVVSANANAMQGVAAIVNATKPPPVPAIQFPTTHQTNCFAAGPSISCTGN